MNNCPFPDVILVIGIEEDTAMVVKNGKEAEVIGSGVLTGRYTFKRTNF